MKVEVLLRNETLAALGALVPLADCDFDPAAAAVAFVRLGDALRLEMPLPRELSRWLGELLPEQLDSIARCLLEDLDTVVIPTTSDDVDALSVAARALDRAESGRIAFLRACAARHHTPRELPQLDPLLKEMDEVRGALGEVAGRNLIEDTLGDRRFLLRGPGWTAALPETSYIEAAEDLGPFDKASLPAPPDPVIAAYVTRGLHRKWIESLAEHQPDFRQRLVDLINALAGAGFALSLVALSWRQRQSHASAPLILSVESPRLAAASTLDRATAETVLGRLDPVPAEASIIYAAGEIELRVFAEPGVLSAVRLGDVVVRQPDEHGDWIARAPIPTAPILISVTDLTGQHFEEVVEVRFEALED